MAETSLGFPVDYEIVRGARAVKGLAARVRAFVSLPSAEGFPSEYPKHPERRDVVDPPQLPFPGEIGGVACKPSILIQED